MSAAPLQSAAWLAGWVALGVTLGAAYFALLRWNSALYLREGRRGLAVLLQLARFAVLALVFWQLARLGAWPLLAAFAGLLVARLLVLRGARA